ncbi:DUF4145 domain-containing protein [Oceanobacter sp. 4_MG-2023]|uniref:DUF4145 domain-containing protein n=1 Tax=Oceanobacter sp. 4_MG-2023 TaxID=3062623 RepID=UPI0027339C03|nr:DUF4145 domain-containing protein [Oceanobacter sp. 4_MG-2023]MDP2549102.1 DUF4145 domain-containing protein [Oceanobacter sp. 4_MG-2023]
MEQHYEAPEIDKDAFTCPYCGAFSAMRWDWIRTHNESLPLKRAECHRCSKMSVWRAHYLEGGDTLAGNMIDPDVHTAPLPNEDLPDVCRCDYMEARDISNKSPRGSAALLRLCIQKLCSELGGKGKNINDDIAILVASGLPQRIQQALDIVRVVGNNAVHPGEISVEDQPNTVVALFRLINLIVDNQITQPKQVASLFDALPEGAKQAVEKRDGKA